jgi:hypothetical protein
MYIHGSFLFGATEKLSEATVDVDSLQPVVILRLRNMTAAVDATGLHELERLADGYARRAERCCCVAPVVNPTSC